MKYFRINYLKDGSFEILKANSAIELIKKYCLYTKEHINTRIVELEGEQEAIAIANEE